MYTDQCISVTELRRQTGKFIGGDVPAEQFVFIGSKPMSAILTMSRYEELKKLEDRLYEQELDLHFVPYDALSQSDKDAYDEAIAKPNSSYIDF